MATTFKLLSTAASDGTVYLDMPISGRLTKVTFSGYLIAGAGGVGTVPAELSRVATNQNTTNNPRGVIAAVLFCTSAASTGICQNVTQYPNEQVRSGERLYLNCAGYSANVSSTVIFCLLTIE